MTESDETELITRRMSKVPQLDEIGVFLDLKKTGDASDVTVKYHTDPGEPMTAELVIKVAPGKKDRVNKILEDWESKGLI